MSNKMYISALFILGMFSMACAQIGYKKDSLQIKVYTEIKYKNFQPVDLRVKKVFCDYCTKNQIQIIGEQALRLTKEEQYNPKYVSENDKARLALFIRVAKKDFAKLKDNNNPKDNN